MEDFKVPLVDAPVVALHSGAVLPKDGENALKDSANKKNKAALRRCMRPHCESLSGDVQVHQGHRTVGRQPHEQHGDGPTGSQKGAAEDKESS